MDRTMSTLERRMVQRVDGEPGEDGGADRDPDEVTRPAPARADLAPVHEQPAQPAGPGLRGHCSALVSGRSGAQEAACGLGEVHRGEPVALRP